MMNKKAKILITVAVILVIAASLLYFVFFNKTDTAGTFDLAQYSTYIENFPSDQVLGTVDSPKAAKEKAEAVWLEIYGETVKEEKPYQVLFDEANQVWLVHGTIPKGMDGGEAFILMQKADGKVLAVWHDK